MRKIKELPNSKYIEFDYNEHFLNFTVYEKVNFVDGDYSGDGEVVVLSGRLKWSGCMDWTLSEDDSISDDKWYHTCDIEDIHEFHNILINIQKLGVYIGNWNGER